MIRRKTRLTALAALLALTPAAGQASIWGSEPSSPASLPADLGRLPGDAAIMQIVFHFCQGDAGCTGRAWTSSIVQLCRSNAADSAVCFGPMGAVPVALRTQQETSNGGCPAGQEPIEGIAGTICVRGPIID